MEGEENHIDVKGVKKNKLDFDPEAHSKAVKVGHIPFGFFEKELSSYFTQFGRIQRVRVARSKKTGNAKGWAYILFANSDVAQIAAEAMDGYLMYEKRLTCKLIKNKHFPNCLRRGPRLIKPPAKFVSANRHGIRLNEMQSGWHEEAARRRILKNIKEKKEKLGKIGYRFSFIRNGDGETC